MLKFFENCITHKEIKVWVCLYGFNIELFIFQLEDHKNLVDQCVQGEGLVQVNIQIQSNLQRINIIDVLKPAEDYVHVGKLSKFKYKMSSFFLGHFIPLSFVYFKILYLCTYYHSIWNKQLYICQRRDRTACQSCFSGVNGLYFTLNGV